MANEECVNRRNFFRRTVSHFLNSISQQCSETSFQSCAEVSHSDMPTLTGDLSPELLEIEAERLKIDRDDKEKILKELKREMSRQSF